MQDELTEAQLKMSELVDAGSELRANLEAAVEAGDATNMIRLQDLISRNNIFRYAQQGRIIRLEKTADQEDRNVALYEKKLLEDKLIVVTRAYGDRLREAEDARVAMMLVQVKLFGIESRIENDRVSIGDKQKQLMEHIALWKQQAHKPLEAIS